MVYLKCKVILIMAQQECYIRSGNNFYSILLLFYSIFFSLPPEFFRQPKSGSVLLLFTPLSLAVHFFFPLVEGWKNLESTRFKTQEHEQK